VEEGPGLRSENEQITVLVVDDDGEFRGIVGAVLADEKDIEIVGQAGDGREAVALAQELVPDVVLLDIHMPLSEGPDSGEARGASTSRGGIEAVAQISRQVPTTKVVMLTASDEEDDVYEALRAGAGGYVMKDDFLRDLAGVIRTMADDLGLLLSPTVATKVLAQFKQAPQRSTEPGLSDREVEVLGWVALGKTNDQIAELLFLSSHTVKRHVANILAKLHQGSRADAVTQAVRRGYLSATDTALAPV